jgi:hypothetical protein
LPRPHQPRERRHSFVEVVQIDGSMHAWFEDHGAECSLLVHVDDATRPQIGHMRVNFRRPN